LANDLQSELDRMHGFHVSQGEHCSFVELWRRAMKARLQLLDALDGVSNEQASFKPVPVDSSINEVALHILNGSRIVRWLVMALVRDQSGDSSDIDPARRTTEAISADVRQDLNIVLAEFVDDVLNTALHPGVVEEKSRLARVG
jgi:hypothetical protein